MKPKSPSASRREREREEHRNSILLAAETIFAAKGYDETTIAEIAREAQFSVGSIYNFFPGKRELGEAVMLRIATERVSDIEALSGKKFQSGDEALTEYARVWVHHYAIHGAFLRMGMDTMRRRGISEPPKAIAEQIEKHREVGNRFFENNRKYFRDVPTPVLYQAAEGLLHHAMFLWFRYGKTDLVELERKCIEFLPVFFRK